MRALKFLSLCLAGACAALLLSSCKAQDTLVAGVGIADKPLGFRDSGGNLTGYEVDMAREAALHAGLTVKFVPIQWSDGKKALQSGKVNSLWGEITAESENQADMLYTRPYLQDSQVLVVESSSDIKSVSGLSGKIAGSVSDSPAMKALRGNLVCEKLQSGVPQEYYDCETAFMAMDSGQADALAINATLADYTLMQDAGKYRVLSENLSAERYSLAFRRNDSYLRNKIQAALDAMKKDGTSARISKKWFDRDLTVR